MGLTLSLHSNSANSHTQQQTDRHCSFQPHGKRIKEKLVSMHLREIMKMYSTYNVREKNKKTTADGWHIFNTYNHRITDIEKIIIFQEQGMKMNLHFPLAHRVSESKREKDVSYKSKWLYDSFSLKQHILKLTSTTPQ